jgi:transcriptional regulator with XRE-family HTH domain
MQKRMTSIDKEIGERVRVARQRARVSQAALGEALGLTFQQVQKYENGTNRISAGCLHRISQSLKVPIART